MIDVYEASVPVAVLEAQTRIQITSPYVVHQAVAKLMADGRQAHQRDYQMFRAGGFILVRCAAQRPAWLNWRHVEIGAVGDPVNIAGVVCFEQADSMLRRKVRDARGGATERVRGQAPTDRTAQKLQYLLRRAVELAAFETHARPPVVVSKADRSFSIRPTGFVGHGRIADREAMSELLACGIGRSRAFGFGMVMVEQAALL